MSRSKNAAQALPIPLPLRAVPQEQPAPAALPAMPTLATARVVGLPEDGVLVELGGRLVKASREATVHPSVIQTAYDRGERVLVERDEAGALVVVGALRTQPTPGIEAADEYTIEAGRIALRAKEELSLGAEAASLVMRAIGEIETHADRIVSRAESVQKIVARMLHLN